MGPVVKGLIGLLGSGVGAAAEYVEHQRSRQRNFTPSASEAGSTAAAPNITHDEPQATAIRPTRPQDEPPTYAESVDIGSDRQLHVGPPPQEDHKIQHDDDLHGDDSSDFDDDSDVTLDGLVAEDEAAWYLDEFAAANEPPSYEDATNVPSEDDLVREIIAGQHQQTHGQLPCPVILPQRRPKNKSRGFVRAYAPVLQNVGIDQTTFLKFLYNLHKSSQASPWFTVIEVSALSAHAAGPVGFAIEAAVKVAVEAGRNIEVAKKTNNFLDRMNKELFNPAGCIAFIMKYKTKADAAEEAAPGFFGVVAANVNLATNQVVAKYDREGDAMAGLMNKMQMFRIASDTTEGAENLPESAPLIFPDVDKEIARTGKQTWMDKGREVNAFMQDYLDRREQIRFSRQDSNSALQLPGAQRQMKSSLADPDHPAFNSGVVGLLTGGYVNLQSFATQRREAKADRRAARGERRQERRAAHHERKLDRNQRRLDRGVRHFERKYGRTPSSTSVSTASEPRESKVVEVGSSQRGDRADRGHRRRRRGGVRGTVGKLMSEDVLYLMVVNLPKEQAPAAA